MCDYIVNGMKSLVKQEMTEDDDIEDSILPDTDIKQELTDGEEDKQQPTCSSLQSTNTTTHIYDTPRTVHQDGSAHICTLCGKNFSSKHHLKRHISFATFVVKPLVCTRTLSST